MKNLPFAILFSLLLSCSDYQKVEKVEIETSSKNKYIIKETSYENFYTVGLSNVPRYGRATRFETHRKAYEEVWATLIEFFPKSNLVEFKSNLKVYYSIDNLDIKEINQGIFLLRDTRAYGKSIPLSIIEQLMNNKRIMDLLESDTLGSSDKNSINSILIKILSLLFSYKYPDYNWSYSEVLPKENQADIFDNQNQSFLYYAYSNKSNQYEIDSKLFLGIVRGILANKSNGNLSKLNHSLKLWMKLYFHFRWKFFTTKDNDELQSSYSLLKELTNKILQKDDPLDFMNEEGKQKYLLEFQKDKKNISEINTILRKYSHLNQYTIADISSRIMLKTPRNTRTNVLKSILTKVKELSVFQKTCNELFNDIKELNEIKETNYGALYLNLIECNNELETSLIISPANSPGLKYVNKTSLDSIKNKSFKSDQYEFIEGLMKAEYFLLEKFLLPNQISKEGQLFYYPHSFKLTELRASFLDFVYQLQNNKAPDIPLNDRFEAKNSNTILEISKVPTTNEIKLFIGNSKLSEDQILENKAILLRNFLHFRHLLSLYKFTYHTQNKYPKFFQEIRQKLEQFTGNPLININNFEYEKYMGEFFTPFKYEVNKIADFWQYEYDQWSTFIDHYDIIVNQGSCYYSDLTGKLRTQNEQTNSKIAKSIIYSTTLISKGNESIEAILNFILGHETGHHLQFSNEIYKDFYGIDLKAKHMGAELEADMYSGFYAAHSDGLALHPNELEDIKSIAMSLGDDTTDYINSEDPHGSDLQRLKACQLGISLAKHNKFLTVTKQTKFELHNLFKEIYESTNYLRDIGEIKYEKYFEKK